MLTLPSTLPTVLARVVSVELVEVFWLLVEPSVKPIPPLLSKPDFFFDVEWLTS